MGKVDPGLDDAPAIPWAALTGDPHDPLAVILDIQIRIGDVVQEFTGIFDTGADMTELEPPAIDAFAVNEDDCGFTQIKLSKDKQDTEPLVMAEATFQGRAFTMPVSLLKYPRREVGGKPVHVFGRAGLMDHFRIDLNPTNATARFEWVGRTPNCRLDEIQRVFIDERRGKAKQYQGTPPAHP